MAAALTTHERDELIDVERRTTRSGDLHVCAECKYAQLFAVQPRAVCTRQGSASAGMVVFAGQPACADMAPRRGRDMVLSAYASHLEKTRMRFASSSARIH